MFSILRGCFCVYRRTETCWRTKGVTTGLQRKYAAYSVLFQSGLPLKLHSSKGSFRQKARLSPLSISVWFRCRQRGQPFGLPSVALPESTPLLSMPVRSLGYRHGPTGRPSGRSSRRAAPYAALGSVNTIEFLFACKEDKPALRECTLLVLDRKSR